MDEMMLGAAAGAGADHHRDSLSRLMASLPMPMAVAAVQPPPQSQTQQVEVPGTSGSPIPPKRELGAGVVAPVPVPGERLPQWTPQETRDFIAIRADLERDFTVSKRNKTLWEAVAARMRDRGYRRSPEQCKCKWKNLVNRYKGKETSDPENGRQCPFFEELHAVFTERARSMQRLLLESESGGPRAKNKLKRTSGDKSDDEFSEEDDDEGDDSEEDRPGKSKKRKTERERQTLRGGVGEKPSARSAGTAGGIIDILQEFFQHQQRMEQQWQDMMERRAQERRLFEQEWRHSMEKLERERLMLETEWRQREEQRRIREESRAEKRDALLTALLSRLLQEDF